jgi:hypothetical protein
MWPFRRRAGKHELGAAVTAIPSVRVTPAIRPASYGAFVGRPARPPAPERIPAQQASPEDLVTAPVPPHEVPVAVAPRVELGFRDGSTAALAPGSEQARALSEIASVLTQRD